MAGSEFMKKHLNSQSILLLAVNGLFVLAGALSGTFLNVYIWKVKPDFNLIAWFTFSQQVALGLVFWIAGKWVKERDKMIFLRLGMIVSGIFYLLVLWTGKHTVDYIWPLGLLFGTGSGLFWLAFNVVLFRGDRCRDAGSLQRLGGDSGFGDRDLRPVGLRLAHLHETRGGRLPVDLYPLVNRLWDRDPA
ncbi:hypothetical protein HMSSN139_34600 [Paenibacillus sp. HMSSN-139]|nr:hypothetical protein HMSSN139_34600 [Paenibacillus sp. HMSSN-139]